MFDLLLDKLYYTAVTSSAEHRKIDLSLSLASRRLLDQCELALHGRPPPEVRSPSTWRRSPARPTAAGCLSHAFRSLHVAPRRNPIVRGRRHPTDQGPARSAHKTRIGRRYRSSPASSDVASRQ